MLNDGIIPPLSGISNNSESQWATNLFTMRRRGKIIVSFEVEPALYSYMKMAMFNCPDLGISTSMINVYSSTSFRPEDNNKTLGNLIANYISANYSCSQLITYTIEFNQKTSQSYFNLEFPSVYMEGSNSSYVFLGEVAFLMEGELQQSFINMHGNHKYKCLRAAGHLRFGLFQNH